MRGGARPSASLSGNIVLKISPRMVILVTLSPDRERPNRIGKLPHPINYQIANTCLIRPHVHTLFASQRPPCLPGSGAHCFSGLLRRVLVSIGQLLRNADVFCFLRETSPKPLACIHKQRTTRVDPNHLAVLPPARQPCRVSDPEPASWSDLYVVQRNSALPPV